MKYKVGQIIRVRPKGVCKDNFIGEITKIYSISNETHVDYKHIYGDDSSLDTEYDCTFTIGLPWERDGVTIVADDIDNIEAKTLKLLYER